MCRCEDPFGAAVEKEVIVGVAYSSDPAVVAAVDVKVPAPVPLA